MSTRKRNASRSGRGDALEYLYDRYIGDDPELRAVYEAELVNVEIARRIYDLRTAAGLSQAKLARLVRLATSDVARLEAADYERDALMLLHRIASALDRRVEIRLVPLKRRTA